MIASRAHPEGVVLPIKAQPGARKNELRGLHAGRLKVCVTAAPEKGQANAAIVELLCEELSLRPAQCVWLAGHTSSQKELLIRGLTSAELNARLTEKLGE